MKDISIVIRTYNETENLAKTLDLISKQKLKNSFETVFVDSGSDTATINVIKK